jgi:ribosome-binding protein aMBF1 (putative translation factor)
MRLTARGRRIGRPPGKPELTGRCLRRVPFGEGYRTWARMMGEQLQHVREECGVPAVELAAAIGVEECSVRRMERGDAPPTLRRLKQIADALGVLVMDLVPRAS